MLFSSANSFIPLASLAVLSSIVVSHASPLPETQLPIKDRSDLIAVGFDLTVDYGTASIIFPDGTFYDAIKIDGEDEYKSMMRRLVDAAINQPTTSLYGRFYNTKANFKTKDQPQNINQVSLDAGARNLQASRWREKSCCKCSGPTTDSTSNPPHKSDECACPAQVLADIHTLSSMIRRLRATVEYRLSTNLQAVAVSIPTITSLQAATAHAALRLAGLQNVHPDKGTLSAASAAIINMEIAKYVPDTISSPNILVLEYQPFALVSTLDIDNPKPVSRAILDEAAGSIARHSHTFSSEWGYWRYVRDAMSRLAKKFPDTPVNVVVVVGDVANEQEFVKNAAEAIESFPEGLLRSPQVVLQRPLFSAARGAATFAKRAAKGLAVGRKVEGTDTAVKSEDVVESENSEERYTELR